MYQDDKYTIKKMAHGDPELWQALCPLAVSRKVRKELGIAISSDEGYKWLIAFDNNGNTVAIAAVEFCNGAKAIFRHAYIVQDHRECGLCTKMLNLRELLAVGKHVTATVSGSSLNILARAGYIKTGKRGKYTTVEKQL